MAVTKTEAELALERAHNELTESRKNVTVRALRDLAKVDNNTAAAWLRARRVADQAPSPVPADVIASMGAVLQAQIVEPIWARCEEQAVKQVQQKHSEELLALVDQREVAVADAERAVKQLDALTAKNKQLTTDLAEADKNLKSLRSAQSHWLRESNRLTTEAAEARERAAAAENRAHQADVARVQAETELATLREALAALRPQQDAP